MADRRRMPWLAGLTAVAIVCLGLGVTLDVSAAVLFHEADEYYRSNNGSAPPPIEESAYYDRIWLTSSALHAAVSPVLAGAVLAALGLLATLGLLWEQRERRRV